MNRYSRRFRKMGTAARRHFAWSFMLVVSVCVAGCGPDNAAPASEAPPAVTDSDFVLGEIPEIVATVGDTKITREAFLRGVRNLREFAKAKTRLATKETGKPQEIPKFTAAHYDKMLNTMVKDAAIQILAKREGIVADEARLEAKIEEDKAKLASDNAYHDMLRKMGTSEDLVRQDYRRMFIRDAFIARQGQDCTASEARIKAAYDRLKAVGALKGPEEADFWHIAMRVGPTENEDAWKDAEFRILEAQQRVLSGEDFIAVALDVSEDEEVQNNQGLYRNGVKKRMAKEMREGVFSLQIGEVSDPVRSKAGWHLIKMKAYRPEGQRTLEDVRERLTETVLANCRKSELDLVVSNALDELDARILYHAGDR